MTISTTSAPLTTDTDIDTDTEHACLAALPPLTHAWVSALGEIDYAIHLHSPEAVAGAWMRTRRLEGGLRALALPPDARPLLYGRFQLVRRPERACHLHTFASAFSSSAQMTTERCPCRAQAIVSGAELLERLPMPTGTLSQSRSGRARPYTFVVVPSGRTLRISAPSTSRSPGSPPMNARTLGRRGARRSERAA